MSLRRPLVALLVAALPLPVIAAQWTATFGQVGPLRVGMSLTQVNQVLDARLAAPNVPTADPTGRCFYVVPPRDPELELMIIDDRLARIDVVKSSIKTTTGIAVGDTAALVASAYGSRVNSEPDGYHPRRGRYLTVLSANGQYGMRFVILDGKVMSYYSGTPQTIQFVEGCA